MRRRWETKPYWMSVFVSELGRRLRKRAGLAQQQLAMQMGRKGKTHAGKTRKIEAGVLVDERVAC
jgi:hypothetical protein